MTKILLGAAFIAILSACSSKPQVTCSGDDAKAIVTSILKDSLVKKISADFSRQFPASTAGLDGSLVRATVDKVVIALDDILTTKSDPDSTKKFCTATVRFSIPQDVVKSAEDVRAMLTLRTLGQEAMSQNVEFDANTVKSSLDYGVQPTDDGKKTYGSLSESNPGLTFTGVLLEESFLKSAMEKQRADQALLQQQQALQAQQRQTEIDQAQLAETQAVLQKAQADIVAANNAINVVWNAGTKQWRQDMLAEQRLWLAQRTNGCKLNALDTNASASITYEINRLNCEVQMTSARTEVLRASAQQSLLQPQ
jgi:hypothetical protein